MLRVWYTPTADVEFTWQEVTTMIVFSRSHYDLRCRTASVQGGILYGMMNRFKLPLNLGTENDKAMRRGASITVRLGVEEVDLLAKIVEQDPSFGKLLPVVKRLNKEWMTINRKNLKAQL